MNGALTLVTYRSVGLKVHKTAPSRQWQGAP
jgi:hypothetical protein